MPDYGSLDLGFGTVKGQFMDKGTITSLRNTRRGNYWDSYVARPPEGNTLIGHDAKNMQMKHPELVAHGFKEFLGDDVKRYFNKTATATEVMAMMLVVVVAHMVKQKGSGFDGFVVTCPANYTDQQRRGLLKACDMAGIIVIQIITEPAAAALAYAVRDAAGVGRRSYILCADLGHGTFDSSLLEVFNGEAVPISTEGVARLGGRDFTEVLEKILLEKASKAAGKPIAREKLSPSHAAQLRESAEAAKIDLSGQPSTNIPLHFGGQTHGIEITKQEYDTACKGLVQQMLDCVDLTMRKAGKTFTDLETFVLAGAPFNSSALQEVMAHHTGIVTRVEKDPATVVSYGAMLHAQNLARKAGGQVSLPDAIEFHEATPHDVGIAVVDEESPNRQKKCVVIITKNTPIPCKCTKNFRPERATQTSVAVDVLHGADGALAADCVRIAGFVIPGIKQDNQRAKRIEVTFDVDKNGLLKVTAKDGDDGPSESVTLQLKK